MYLQKIVEDFMDFAEAAEAPCTDTQITNKISGIILKVDFLMMMSGNGDERLLIIKLDLILKYIFCRN